MGWVQTRVSCVAILILLILNFKDYNFKRAVDACLAASQKLSEAKITDLDEARKFCEDQIKQSGKK